MTGRRQPWISALVAIAALQAAPLHGQEPESTPIDSATAEAIRARAEEFASARLHLDTLLERVFEENPGLRDRLEELETAYVETMVALDPETTRRRARIRDLEGVYDRAVLDDDTMGVRTLVREGFELLKALKVTAAEAALRPAVAGELHAFRTAVVARLTTIDPDAVRLLARHDVLETRIAATVLGLR